MISRERLAHVSPGTILVNTARLGLLDENAVAAALSDGRLGGLGLDAKLAADSPLRKLVHDDRMLITPHVGWYSERSARELRRLTIQRSIDAFNETQGKAKVGEKQ
jgi:lactate dehydrogenase-like 2-hydroxyacid dehydrogenase